MRVHMFQQIVGMYRWVYRKNTLENPIFGVGAECKPISMLRLNTVMEENKITLSNWYCRLNLNAFLMIIIKKIVI